MKDNALQELDNSEFQEETLKLSRIKGKQQIPDIGVEESQAGSQSTAFDLTIVIPTRDERDNIVPLLIAMRDALYGMNVEIIFVDDSDDDTPLIIRNASIAMKSSSFHVVLEYRQPGVERVGGLATAVNRGLSIAQANYVAVIDADLQHPPAQLRVFYDLAVARDGDLVVATRYIKGGSYEGLDGISRRLFSWGFKWIAKLLFPEQLRRVSDPLGGFFLLRRTLLTGVTLRPIGYKILLEILLRCQWQRLIEVPYHFHARANGKSKANMKQGIMALQHMWRLLIEVPAAGRIWKLIGTVAMNFFVIFTLLTLSNNNFAEWIPLRAILFVLLGLANFILINRIIFPPVNNRSADLSATIAVHDELTKPLPSALIDNKPTKSLPAMLSVHVPGTKAVLQLNGVSFKERLQRFIPLFIVVITVGWIIATLPGAWLILAALFIGLSLLASQNVSKHQAITVILGVAVGLSIIDYLTWRFEVANWGGWWIAVPLLAAETFGALHTLGFQYTLWPRPRPQLLKSDNPSRYPIFIFIPTVNEGITILEPTLRGAISAREHYLSKYPHSQVTIVVCNDGLVTKASNWQETEALAGKLGVCCITRTVGGGAKAGNIEHARQQLQATGDSLIVIFDADQIAKPDFLLKTIPPFGDPTIGWVQTGQYYSNLDNPVARWADDQQAMFYNLLCPGKASINASFICGTNVVLRASALDQIGGLPQDSVTEDFAASIILHSQWRSLFLTDILATGLGPMDLPSYLKQQRRWAIGTLGVLRTHWRNLFLPGNRGLSYEQRIQYFLACTHYLCGLRDLIYLLSPILFILLGVPAVKGSTLGVFLWHFLPYFVSSTAALCYAGRGITGLRGIIIGFGSFPVLIESFLSVLLRRKVGFTVTSKHRGSLGSLNYLLVYIVFSLVCVACIILAVHVKGRQESSMFISMLWIIYSLCLLVSFLWLSYKDIRSHSSYREPTRVNAGITSDYPSRLRNREQGLRPMWNLGLALFLAAFIFIGRGISVHAGYPTPVAINQLSTDRPYLGVSLPLALLKSRPATLEQKLSTHFAIIERTQDVHDLFDRSWADQLAQKRQRPWITLEFGVFDASGKPPLNASLMAINNGMLDDEIKRWAQDIRDYGKPVYLTILLHVDRNWSLSSAVANGSIPQDAPKAWNHVQSIFKELGATNVAWVWAPADPAHDTLYAPPPSTIDAILLSLISYPHTQWANPEIALHDVKKRYPTKPVILEVSADGPANQKAAWLANVGRAVATTSGIYALIYHEGSPQIRATLAEDNQWSLLSDEQSLMTMRQIVFSFTQSQR